MQHCLCQRLAILGRHYQASFAITHCFGQPTYISSDHRHTKTKSQLNNSALRGAFVWQNGNIGSVKICAQLFIGHILVYDGHSMFDPQLSNHLLISLYRFPKFTYNQQMQIYLCQHYSKCLQKIFKSLIWTHKAKEQRYSLVLQPQSRFGLLAISQFTR